MSRTDGEKTAVAGGIGASLVAWSDFRSGSLWELYGARVGADGVVSDSGGFLISPVGSGAAPSVAYDGATWLIAWGEGWPTGNVHAARVDASGAILDPADTGVAMVPSLTTVRTTYKGVILDPGGFAVAQGEVTELMPSVASPGNGLAAVAYMAFDPSPLADSFRVKLRLLGDEVLFPLGAPCATEADCSSAACVDGVCCDSPCGGDDPDDCLACSARTGAPLNGVCDVATSGTACRPATGPCDTAEVCDGVAAACPTDGRAPEGMACADPCSGAGVCVGGACAPITPDGGVPVDAAISDAANAAIDAHLPDVQASEGCSCQVRGNGGNRMRGGPLILLVMLVGAPARMRRRRGHPTARAGLGAKTSPTSAA